MLESLFNPKPGFELFFTTIYVEINMHSMIWNPQFIKFLSENITITKKIIKDMLTINYLLR